MSLLDGFEELGTETRLVVGAKHTSHPRVVSIHDNPQNRPTPAPSAPTRSSACAAA